MIAGTVTPVAERNADSSPVNDHRNGPMTNAERQKRYRDKLRGGPPVGRWACHLSVAKAAQIQGIGRTMIFMAGWISKYAPEYEEQIISGKIKALTPLYHRLKSEYEAKLFKALNVRPSDGATLFFRREDDEFVFEWTEE